VAKREKSDMRSCCQRKGGSAKARWKSFVVSSKGFAVKLKLAMLGKVLKRQHVKVQSRGTWPPARSLPNGMDGCTPCDDRLRAVVQCTRNPDVILIALDSHFDM